MFDVGFSEIVVIAVVALIVIGPERLPKTARTLGHLFGRLQRYVNEVKADINREMELDELRKLQQEVKSAAREIESSVQSAARDFESSARAVESEIHAATRGVTEATPPAAMPAPAPGEPSPAGLPAPPAAGPPPATPQVAAAQGQQATLPGFEKI
jgi:sec-independent protein translocase protein TatB